MGKDKVGGVFKYASDVCMTRRVGTHEVEGRRWRLTRKVQGTMKAGNVRRL